MKKYLFILIGLVCLVTLSSCGYGTPIVSTTEIVKTSVITTKLPAETTTTTQTITTTVPVLMVIDPNSGNRYTVEQGSSGIANADNTIHNYAIGLDTPPLLLYILNGTSDSVVYKCFIEPYATADESYRAAPQEIHQWVSLTHTDKESPLSNMFLVQAMDVSVLTAQLNVPKGAVLPAHWGFMIGVASYQKVRSTQGFVSLGYELISDTDIVFSWELKPVPEYTPGVGGQPNLDGYPDKVMIRSKVGDYPIPPSDSKITPNDGTLLYYGQGNTCEDMQCTPYTYYSIYVQKKDGSWFMASGIQTVHRSAARFLVDMR